MCSSDLAIGANQNGMDFIAVTYGFGFDKNSCYKNHNISYISDDVKDLILYFDQN